MRVNEGGTMTELDHYTSKDERTWSTVVHLSALCALFIPFGHVLGPLVIWLIKRAVHSLRALAGPAGVMDDQARRYALGRPPRQGGAELPDHRDHRLVLVRASDVYRDWARLAVRASGRRCRPGHHGGRQDVARRSLQLSLHLAFAALRRYGARRGRSGNSATNPSTRSLIIASRNARPLSAVARAGSPNTPVSL